MGRAKASECDLPPQGSQQHQAGAALERSPKVTALLALFLSLACFSVSLTGLPWGAFFIHHLHRNSHRSVGRKCNFSHSPNEETEAQDISATSSGVPQPGVAELGLGPIVV